MIIDRENMSTIAGAGNEMAILIEGQGIDQIFARTPQPERRSVGGNAVDLRASGRAQSRRGEGARRLRQTRVCRRPSSAGLSARARSGRSDRADDRLYSGFWTLLAR